MIADIVFVAVLAISAVIALIRGFVKETLTVAGWVGAIFITLYGYPYLAALLSDLITETWIAATVAASTLFLVSLVILTILSHLLASRVQGSMLNHLDRALGFVFGLVRGIVLVSMVYLGGTVAWDEDNLPDEIADAKSLPLVKLGADFLASLAPEDAFPGRDDPGDRIDDAVDKIKEEVEDAAAAVAREKLDEMVDEIDAEERLRRLNEPEPDTGNLQPEAAPSDYSNDETSDMQRLIDSNQ